MSVDRKTKVCHSQTIYFKLFIPKLDCAEILASGTTTALGRLSDDFHHCEWGMAKLFAGKWHFRFRTSATTRMGITLCGHWRATKSND